MFNGPWVQELGRVPWGIVLVITALAGFGCIILYSAAGGSLSPWALKHGLRFAILMTVSIGIALVKPERWMALAWPIYGAVLVGLIGVELLGRVGGGSQRWLDLGFIQLQPSEFMKIAVVLILARYYHFLPKGYETKLNALLPALALIALPAGLVMLQPDLGTALSITFGGVMVMFLAGVRLWLFLGAGVAAIGAMPLVWSLLHDYQKRRVLIFLDPATDPRGAGYHITQSKIAIGSGGFSGKGYLAGTQSHLDYLPELQTDFIFATMAEEWGFLGGLFIIGLYGFVLAWGISVALKARGQFQRLLAMGLTMTLFFYLAINMMMVMGLAPVVGIPLPLISYGGSAMMTVLVLLGLIMGIARQNALPQN
jgi:rod shape determining protein RodA